MTFRYSLTALRSVLPTLPVSLALHNTVRDLQPRGRIDELQLRWQGERPSASGFDLVTRFSGVHVAAGGSRPGVSNLSGSVRGNEKSGGFELQGKSMYLDLPEVFRESRVPLDTLQARGKWKKHGEGVLFTLAQLDFANVDAAGSGQGSYETVKNHAGRVNLTARLTRGNGTAVHRYLPKKIGDLTVAWVKRAIVAGTSNDTRLTLRGDLDRYPIAAVD